MILFRRLIKLAIALLVLLLVVLAVSYHFADQYFNRGRDLPKVLAVPPGTFEQGLREPYRGPHPRLMQRPTETYAFPIAPGEVGPIQPLFAAGPNYPYFCRTIDSKLGQPMVDNQAGIGMAVFAEDGDGEPTGNIIGYSKDCLLPTRIHHYYHSKSEDSFEPLGEPLGEISSVTLDGRQTPFIVHVETGTINRHIYLIAFLEEQADSQHEPNMGRWNQRLIYYFRGGVGIGRRQGRTAIKTILKRRMEALSNGYAVAYSSANQTSNTYNIWRNEDAALRVKQQFVSAYGKPLYTVGLGGSGGAIQQYLLAQNRPGLLDAAIALYSFPDMVTQANNILDCELLERYFDHQALDQPRWADVGLRSAINGMSASSELMARMAPLAWAAELSRGQWPDWDRGSTECTRSWRGMTQLVLNPNFAHFSDRFAPDLIKQVEWTYWADLIEFFGTDRDGFARRTWDNVGVQYGLKALQDGAISVPEFLDLNRRIGGWKQSRAMRPPTMWINDVAPSSLAEFSPWDSHNMTLLPANQKRAAAPRTTGDIPAIRAAYRSGQVFLGLLDIPLIDLRHYLDPELDMHHASASFAARQRIIEYGGDTSLQLIWVTKRPHTPYARSLDLIDRWLTAMLEEPGLSAAQARPDDARDTCFDSQGQLLASGAGVWDGEWNKRSEGHCMQRYPIYGTSRTAAGEPLSGNGFKCQLQSVPHAIERGIYLPVDIHSWQDQLFEIFPDGVCDYSLPGQGFPEELRQLR